MNDDRKGFSGIHGEERHFAPEWKGVLRPKGVSGLLGKGQV